jgi:hypothetical protein
MYLTNDFYRGMLGTMPKLKKNLTPAELAIIGDLVFHDNWEESIARLMDIEPDIVRDWAKHGTPEGVAAKLRMHLGAHKAHIGAALEDFLEQPLKPWERGDAIIDEYEGINPDPNMVSRRSGENEENITRAIADLLHCGSYKNNRAGLVEDLLRAAEALYLSELPQVSRAE